MKTYKVEFNDYGIVYITANGFAEALEKFWNKFKGNSPEFTITAFYYKSSFYKSIRATYISSTSTH